METVRTAYCVSVMETTREEFRKMFPNLAKEMKSKERSVKITSMRSDQQAGERASSEKFNGYTPDIIDFLRRCDNGKQAEEIIAYVERRGEISSEYAQKLRRQLRKRGVRSFGPKKEDDYYLKRAGF